MSVIRRARRAIWLTLVAGSFGFALGAAPACAVFGGSKPSTVAQGKYYASGDPHYDEFFIALYRMQVKMADAPHTPDSERAALAQALALPPQSDRAAIGARLREETQTLSHAGVHLRLDKNPAKDKLTPASTTLRSSAPLKDQPNAALLAQVEQSGTNLARALDDATQSEQILSELLPQAISLDTGADAAFAGTHFGKLNEVKKNLADARQLIVLMRSRASAALHTSEELLVELTQAVDTDDGSLGPALAEAGAEPHADAAKVPDASKKARPKAKPLGAAAAPGPASARPKPAPAAAPAPDGDAPAPSPKPSKAPPAPRDFEP